MKRIIECVPNYSEGRNKEVIDQIVKAITETKVSTENGEESVKVLDVDPGEATNRTVVTFVGSPEAVLEAAFQGEKKAAELIDMRHHHGAHPRSGATDVLPLIPVAGTTLEECAEMARSLAKGSTTNSEFLATATRRQPTSRREKISQYAAQANMRLCRKRSMTLRENRISARASTMRLLPRLALPMSEHVTSLSRSTST